MKEKKICFQSVCLSHRGDFRKKKKRVWIAEGFFIFLSLVDFGFDEKLLANKKCPAVLSVLRWLSGWSLELSFQQGICVFPLYQTGCVASDQRPALWLILSRWLSHENWYSRSTSFLRCWHTLSVCVTLVSFWPSLLFGTAAVTFAHWPRRRFTVCHSLLEWYE